MAWGWSHGQMLQQCWGVGKWGSSGPAVLDMDTSVGPHPTHATAPELQLTSQSQSSQKKNKLFLLLSCLLASACQERKTSKETQWWHHRFPWAHHHISIVFTQQTCTISSGKGCGTKPQAASTMASQRWAIHREGIYIAAVGKPEVDRTPYNAYPLAWRNTGCFYTLMWLKTLCKWVSHKQREGAQGGEAKLSLPLQYGTNNAIYASALFSDIWTLVTLCVKHNSMST